MPPHSRVTLTRPELPARSYDFAKEDGTPAPTAEATGGQGMGESGEYLNPRRPPFKGGAVGGCSTPGQKKEKKGKEGASPSNEELAAVLLTLRPSDRRDVLARVALAEREARTGKGRELEMWTVAVYSALVAAVGAGGEVGAGPASVRRLLADPSSWGPVQNFLRHSRLMDLPVARLQSVLNLLAGLVVEHAQGIARKTGVPLTPKFAATCAVHASSVFDAAFPGYGRNPRLAAVLAERLTQRRAQPQGEES